MKIVEPDKVEENLNYEGQLCLGRGSRKDYPDEGLFCAESCKAKINLNSTTISSWADSTTAKRNSGRILRNQYILGFCFFFKPPSLDELDDLETDSLTAENQVLEMTVDISNSGLS